MIWGKYRIYYEVFFIVVGFGEINDLGNSLFWFRFAFFRLFLCVRNIGVG